jgi:hypothetical protein
MPIGFETPHAEPTFAPTLRDNGMIHGGGKKLHEPLEL